MICQNTTTFTAKPLQCQLPQGHSAEKCYIKYAENVVITWKGAA